MTYAKCIKCGAQGYGVAHVDRSGRASLYCRDCYRAPHTPERKRAHNREWMRRKRERAYESLVEAARERAVLGPVPCSDCRLQVIWNGWEWQDLRGDHHACRRRTQRHDDVEKNGAVAA